MKKPAKKITPQQEGLLIKIFLAFVLAAVLWVVFSPGAGLLLLKGQHSDLEQLEKEITELELENHDLQAEIDRLQTDPVYLEEVARKEYGLLKKNERVYDFSKNNKPKKE